MGAATSGLFSSHHAFTGRFFMARVLGISLVCLLGFVGAGAVG